MESYISTKIIIKDSDIHGKGCFAKEDISKGEIVFIKGGYILTRETMYCEKLGDIYWPLDDNFVLAPRNEEEVEKIKLYINHSCQPNCGILGDIKGVAIRDIFCGEEITFDYAMLDNDEYSFECCCGSKNCRHIVTGYDWRIKELQNRYGNYFAQYLLDKIYNENK